MIARRFRFFGLIVSACLASGTSSALVGESSLNGPMAAHGVMVLASRAGKSGFCTGVVIARDVVLTAAHCVAAAHQTRIYFKQGDQPTFLEPTAIATHPQYKADALLRRERSIDLALIRSSLPAQVTPVMLADDAVSLGTIVGVAGFGVTREGDGASAGILRWGKLRARAPLSNILLWADDPSDKDFGACEGDSGGPIFALESGALVAITSWTEGAGDRHCGKLTQAALIAPQRAWIDSVLRGWGVAR
jgi:hypothetical protein